MPPGNEADLTENALASLLARCGVPVPAGILQGLCAYVGMLVRWNRVMNLVGAQSWQEVVRTLVADSFRLAAFLDTLPLPPDPVAWDLGAGAGLPGIPLRLVWQRGTYTLVERRSRRALFLSQATGTLGLPRTPVFCGEAQAFFAAQPACADLVVSRAFMPWQRLLPFVESHVRPGGLVVVMAGATAPESFPAAWRLLAEEGYPVAGKDAAAPEGHRWLWALQRAEGAAAPAPDAALGQGSHPR